MTFRELAAWRKLFKLTQAQAATALGVSLNSFRDYEKGIRPIPRYIAVRGLPLGGDLPRRVK